MAFLTGECLCGKVRYEYKGMTGNLVHCHVTVADVVSGMVQPLEVVW